MLLYNIGDKELTASELRTKGYYLGSNVSYNVKKLVEAGYLHHARSKTDRRSVRISLTDKGRQVHEIIQGLYDKHARTIAPIGGISDDDFGPAQPGARPSGALLDRPDPLSPLKHDRAPVGRSTANREHPTSGRFLVDQTRYSPPIRPTRR